MGILNECLIKLNRLSIVPMDMKIVHGNVPCNKLMR